MNFQAADAKKPLLVVKRIVDQGDHVHFGPGENDICIQDYQAFGSHNTGEQCSPSFKSLCSIRLVCVVK